MKVAIDINKSLEENAGIYFDKAKKAKHKLEGALKAQGDILKKRDKAELIEVEEKTIKRVVQSNKKWFEKLKWFVSSDGLLVVGARDATTNEILVKKQTLPTDVVFHTDMAGSPFVTIKTSEFFNDAFKKQVNKNFKINELKDLSIPIGERIPKTTLQEASNFTAIHSRSWKYGLSTNKVFYVKPEQVSKKANSGEFLAKGSFMIVGETKYIDPVMDFAIGVFDGEHLMAGPYSAVEKNCEVFIKVIQGNEKNSAVAKEIKSVFSKQLEISFELDDIIRLLPSGGCQIKKERKRKDEL